MRICIAPELWRYHVIKWIDSWWVLTRLGFGLISAPRSMTVVLDEVQACTGIHFSHANFFGDFNARIGFESDIA